MPIGLVIYFSKTGHTQQMANTIAEAMTEAGLPTKCKSVEDVNIDDLTDFDAIVVGSPCYYGHMAAQITQFFDDSITKHGKLDGIVGAAFASSANIGGGNETTIVGILNAMMIHGMVVQGDPRGDHYGPVSVGKPDDRVISQCKRRGQRIAELTLKLHK